MHRAAAALALLLLAGCSVGGGGDDEAGARRAEPRPPPPPPAQVDPASRYTYLLVPEWARLHRAYLAWLTPCVYIKEPRVCIERNLELGDAARSVLARLGAPPPRLRRADRLLRRGLASLARASDRQRRLLEEGDETGYLNSFSAFVRDALPDVINGVGELRAHVPGAELPLLAGRRATSGDGRGELRWP